MRFLFAGYELKERFAPHSSLFKVPESCITMDTGLCELHPKASDRAWETAGGITNATTLRYDLAELEDIYNGLPPAERLNYCIYGYSIEAERAKRFEEEIVDRTGVHNRSPKFAYAEQANQQIDGRFVLLGYEVIDASIEWLSAQSSCALSYQEIEAFGSLNKYNLFPDESDAVAFRDYADQAISEHAPFSLWQVWGPGDIFRK